MNNFYTRLPRWTRVPLEITLLIALWFGIQSWQTRDMISGEMPIVHAEELVSNSQLTLPLQTDRPYMVHFWASWCPICNVMEESVKGIAADHPVIGIAMQSGSNGEVIASMQEKGINYPTISDPDGEIGRRFGVNGVPATFLVDSNNTIRYAEKGLSTSWGLRFKLWLLQ